MSVLLLPLSNQNLHAIIFMQLKVFSHKTFVAQVMAGNILWFHECKKNNCLLITAIAMNGNVNGWLSAATVGLGLTKYFINKVLIRFGLKRPLACVSCLDFIS